MKSELYFLAKAALVLTVVDAFIPRAETFVKNHKHKHDQHDSPRKSDHEHPPFHPHPPHYPQPQHYPYSTEINMGLFDLNPFHGGGSGASKAALDEQWEAQQAILRERRGHTAADKAVVNKTKSTAAAAKNIEIAGAAKKFEKLHVDVRDDADHEHKKSLADLFFGVKKFDRN
ncbi:hypothetical protein ACHAXN_004314 [Cyclotella atomus]|jgi:hypothetical protein